MDEPPLPRRGEIWVAHLGRDRKAEPGRARPVLIIQSDALNRAGHPSMLVLPLSSTLRDGERLRVRIGGSGSLAHDAEVMVDQLRTLDRRRLVRPLTSASSGEMRRLSTALAHVLGLEDALAAG